jgi:hypothetical protein
VRPEDLAKLEDAELPTWNLEVGSKSKSSLCFVGEKIGAEPQAKLRQPSQGGVEKPGPEWPTLAESAPPRAVEKPATTKSARAGRYERRRQRRQAAASESEDAREVALLDDEREKRVRQTEPAPSNSQGAEAWSRAKVEELAERGEKEEAQRCADAVDQEAMVKRKAGKPRRLRKAGVRGRRPKVLDLSDRELRKIHQGSHRGLTALWHFLKSQVPRDARRVWKTELNALRDRLKVLVDRCKPCQAYKRRQRGQQKVSERVGANRRVWGDLMCLDKSQETWALVLVDESTAWAEGYVVSKPTGEKVWGAFWQWCSRYGPPREFVTDRGGEFVNEVFVAECEAIGVRKRTSAGAAPDAHGRIERVIETVRWTLDRRGESERRKTVAEWAVVLSTVFNATNNEVRRGEGCASERWLGRVTSTWSNVLSEDDVLRGDETQFAAIREETLEDYRAAVNSTKLRAILRQKTLRGVDRGELAAGAQVWVFRDSGKKSGKRNPRWVGPATVVGVEEHYAHVDRGGVLLCARFADLKLVNEPVQTPDTTEGVVSGKGALQFDLGDSSDDGKEDECQSPKAKWLAGGDDAAREMERDLSSEGSSSEEESSSTGEDSVGGLESDSAGEESESEDVDATRKKLLALLAVCPKNRQRARRWRKQREKVGTCYAALGVFRPEDASVQKDWMGVEWEDLDEERKTAAVGRAMADYEEFASWDSTRECKRGDLKSRGLQVLSGRWVKKAKWKLSDDGGTWLLGGRARWTPRGFEERGVSKEEAESPTAAVSSHFMVETLGNAFGWVSVRADISSAFFQSREFGRNEKEIWLELPPEFQPNGEATEKSERACRRMLKEVPGTKMAPRKWQERLEEELRRGGWVEVSVEKCLWAKYSKVGLEGVVGTHVDDMRGRMTAGAAASLETLLRGTLKVGEFRVNERNSEFVGLQWKDLGEGGTRVWQGAYAEQKLVELELPAQRWKQRANGVTEGERKLMKKVVGQLRWMCRTRTDISYEVSMFSSLNASEWLRVADLERLNKLVRHVKVTADRGIVIPRLEGELAILAVVDAGDPPDSESYDGRWRVAHGISMTGSESPGKVAPLCWVAHKAPRVCHASFDAECVGGIEAVDNGLDFAMLTRELLYGRRPSLLTKLEKRWCQDGRPQEVGDARPQVVTSLHTDSQGVVEKTRKLCLRGMSKRRKNDIADMQELVALGLLAPPIHIAGKTNAFDALTKHKSRTRATMEYLAEWQNGSYEAR